MADENESAHGGRIVVLVLLAIFIIMNEGIIRRLLKYAGILAVTIFVVYVLYSIFKSTSSGKKRDDE